MTGERVAYLDERMRLVMPYDRAVTAEEWNGIQWPPCPKCGATIRVDRADVTTWAERLRHYVPGRMECPNEHDLVPPRAEAGTHG